MYFLDSDICIEFFRGNLRNAREWFERTNPALVKVPAVVKAELLTGALKSAMPKKNQDMVESFLAPFEIVPFDDACAYEYASIRRELEEAWAKIGPSDMMIAATARCHHATLVTNNVKHFARVPGLELEPWRVVEL